MVCLLFDTGSLVALFDPADDSHRPCVEILKTIVEPLGTTIPVLRNERADASCLTSFHGHGQSRAAAKMRQIDVEEPGHICVSSATIRTAAWV